MTLDLEAESARAPIVELLRLLEAAQGSLRSGVRIVERAGSVRLLIGPDTTWQPLVPCGRLIQVPAAGLAPVDGAEWAEVDGLIALARPPEGLTDLQRDVLAAHVALFNALGKLATARLELPGWALRSDPALLRIVRQVKPGYRLHDTAVEAFIATRVAGRLRSPAADSEDSVSVLLGVADLLNHHPRGAVLGGSPGLDIQLVPGPDGECFANYGPARDKIGLALHYGYVDEHVRFAASAAVSVESPRIGRVDVLGAGDSARSSMPTPAIAVDGDTLTMSHVMFHGVIARRWLQSAELALRARGRMCGLSQEAASREALSVLEQIAAANVALLQELSREARSSRDAQPAHAVVASAADAQARIVQQSIDQLARSAGASEVR